MVLVPRQAICTSPVNSIKTAEYFESEDYLTIARRIKTIGHSFNVREGIKPDNTLMTDRAKGIQPRQYGPDAENTQPIEEAKKNYFKAMGFDPKTAKPLKETLVELGLDEVLKTFYAKK